MTKPNLIRAPLSVSDAVTACNVAEAAQRALQAQPKPADKTAQKAHQKAVNAARVAYAMACLNLHRAHQMEARA